MKTPCPPGLTYIGFNCEARGETKKFVSQLVVDGGELDKLGADSPKFDCTSLTVTCRGFEDSGTYTKPYVICDAPFC